MPGASLPVRHSYVQASLGSACILWRRNSWAVHHIIFYATIFNAQNTGASARQCFIMGNQNKTC
jgi:hypothetical protein